MAVGNSQAMPVPPPDDDELEGLLAECLARLSHGEADPLAAVCREHPEHAEALRQRQRGLAELGLWRRPDQTSLPRFGPFTAVRELGRGGMGTVYLAHQERPVRRLAAVKVITGRPSPQALARFDAERQTLARLVHPHLAQVLEAGATATGEPWYAMEFVDGAPLTVWCDRQQAELGQRLQLFLQLCAAVQWAHQQGVLHRDLKPGNVLVGERGGQPVVKVIDFGLAKALQETPDEAAALTEQGQILGTPEYMSPEQALPTAVPVDTRTDVYALGTILYELLAGVLPFDFQGLRRQGFAALQAAIAEQEPPPPSQRLQRLGEHAAPLAARRRLLPTTLIARLRGDLDWITTRALAKDRDQRYPSVGELAADVQHHLRHEPVTAGPPSALYQMRKFVRRHRLIVAFATTLVLGAAAALVVVTHLLLQVQDSLRGFDALDDADRFATLAAQVDDELWRNPERLALYGDLWPTTPQQLPAMQRWLDDVQQLGSRLPELRRQLAALEARGAATAQGVPRFAAPRDQSLHARLAPLVHDLTRILADGGPLATIEARRAWAAQLETATVTGPDAAARWQTAIATIADPAKCPAYQGLRITPQTGFLPLLRDPTSGLYEFAYLLPETTLPEQDGDRWRIDEHSCPVFVLIPGGETRLGLDWPDPQLPTDLRPADTEYLPIADRPGAGRSFPLQLEPFLLAKYELTHAQWELVFPPASNPSAYPRHKHLDLGLTATHPVHSMSPLLADETVRRLGLELPTTAQWQHAARAGTPGPWWTGFPPTAWEHSENLADSSLAKLVTQPTQFGAPDPAHDDTFVLTAPVDSLRPNPFGLFHMLGNVQECSRDPAHKYTDAMPGPGDGVVAPLQQGRVLDRRNREFLGGSFFHAYSEARATRRLEVRDNQAGKIFGIRPSRRLLPPPGH